MKFMGLIQMIILIIFTAMAFVIEAALRVCLLPMAIVALIIMQLCGLKSIISSSAWLSIWKYSMPWYLDRYYIVDAVIKYLAPEEF